MDLKGGDIVLLRVGTKLVYGVGIISGHYEWRDHFGDIGGWDLQHTQRVKWIWREPDNPKVFSDPQAMAWGGTLHELRDGEVRDWVVEICENTQEVDRADIRNIPHSLNTSAPIPEVSIEDVSNYLFEKGDGTASIRQLNEKIDDLVQLSKWYELNKVNPTEHETGAHLVFPLLAALGWI